jgi:hypothetical protein
MNQIIHHGMNDFKLFSTIKTLCINSTKGQCNASFFPFQIGWRLIWSNPVYLVKLAWNLTLFFLKLYRLACVCLKKLFETTSFLYKKTWNDVHFKIITKPYLTIYSNFQTDSLIYPQTSDADMKFCLLLERIQLRVSYEINYSHPCLMKMEKKNTFCHTNTNTYNMQCSISHTINAWVTWRFFKKN